MIVPLTPNERFDRLVQKLSKVKCWEWRGHRTAAGYGVFSHRGKSTGAHKFAWERTHGKLAPNLMLDHLCMNKICVNPDHLEPVSRRANALRSHWSIEQRRRRWRELQGVSADDEEGQLTLLSTT